MGLVKAALDFYNPTGSKNINTPPGYPDGVLMDFYVCRYSNRTLSMARWPW